MGLFQCLSISLFLKIILRSPSSTLDRPSAASKVDKEQLYADAFAISTQQSRLGRFRSDQETLKEFFLDRGDMPAELTAITAAYTGEYAHEPYGIFVFAVAKGKPRLFHMEIDSEGREASN